MNKKLFDLTINEGCSLIDMTQKMNGRQVRLKIIIDEPYDWDAMKFNAIKMIDSLKKYHEDLMEHEKRKKNYDA
jgi:hypothetical protein